MWNYLSSVLKDDLISHIVFQRKTQKTYKILGTLNEIIYTLSIANQLYTPA